MRISQIVIQNFRSIKTARFSPSQFNIFVGKNNHGKTNIIEALQWFYSGKSEGPSIRNVEAGENEDVVVEVEFSDVQEGINEITNSENQTKLRNVVGSSPTMRVRRSSSTPKERQMQEIATGKWKKVITGADSTFNNCIPRFEFIETSHNLKEVSAFKTTTPIGKMLGGVFDELLRSDQRYANFQREFEALFGAEDSLVRTRLKTLSESVRKHLEQQFPDCSEVDFRVKEPAFDDLLKNYDIEINDGVRTTAAEKGDGMQRALMLAIIKTFADHRRDEALGRAFIFFIDEAELHLHPTGQRQLKNALLGLVEERDQVFLTTHSSVFVADDHPQQSVFQVEKEAVGETGIDPVSDILAKQDLIYRLLGGSPGDLLFPPNFLIVEGPSEEALLRAVIQKFYSDRPAIQIVAACGDHDRSHANMEALNLIFRPLYGNPVYQNRLIVVCDAPSEDKQESFRKFKAQHVGLVKRGQFIELPTQQLESYYPDPWREDRKLRGKQKISLAKKVGKEITRVVFEEEMPLIFGALEKCWANAHQGEV